MPLTLLILGGGIYPPLVLLGFWYVRRTERMEQRFVDLLKSNDEPATIAAVVAVTVVTAVIGARGVRVARTPADFLVAARQVPPFLNASAISGEYLSAASFLGHRRPGHARRARRPLVCGGLRRRVPGAPGRGGRAASAIRRLHHPRFRRRPAGLSGPAPGGHRHGPGHLRVLPAAPAERGRTHPAGGLRGTRTGSAWSCSASW